jgi:protein-tyrosine phosphatase
MNIATGLSKSIGERYGRKAGFLRHHLHMTRYRLGLLSGFEKVDWRAVKRLVLVCKGNICRSAYAEKKAQALGMNAISFGLEVDGSPPANDVAVRVARLGGIDLSGHRARSAAGVQVRPEDLLLAMEPCHLKLIALRGFAAEAQLSLLGLWCRQPRPHIEDPCGLRPEYFATCFGFIDDALDRISLRISHAMQG